VKRLVVNADDFGRTPGVNAGVVEAHLHGIVTSATVMVLDGCPAQPDPIVEGACRQDVVAGEPVVAVHTPRFADPDLCAERDERGVLVAGHPVDQEPDVLERLAPAGDLGLGEEPRIRRVDDVAVRLAPDGIEPGHDRRDHAVDAVRDEQPRDRLHRVIGQVRSDLHRERHASP